MGRDSPLSDRPHVEEGPGSRAKPRRSPGPRMQAEAQPISTRLFCGGLRAKRQLSGAVSSQPWGRGLSSWARHPCHQVQGSFKNFYFKCCIHFYLPKSKQNLSTERKSCFAQQCLCLLPAPASWRLFDFMKMEQTVLPLAPPTPRPLNNVLGHHCILS